MDQIQHHCAIANGPPQARVIVIGGNTYEFLARPKQEPAQTQPREQCLWKGTAKNVPKVEIKCINIFTLNKRLKKKGVN